MSAAHEIIRLAKRRATNSYISQLSVVIMKKDGSTEPVKEATGVGVVNTKKGNVSCIFTPPKDADEASYQWMLNGNSVKLDDLIKALINLPDNDYLDEPKRIDPERVALIEKINNTAEALTALANELKKG